MYMVWGQVCGAAIRCLQTQVVNSIIRYSSGEEGMLQHSITHHTCPVDATAVEGNDGRDQGLRRRHLTSMGRRSLNFRVRQMARHPALSVGLEFGFWAILAIAVAFAVLRRVRVRTDRQVHELG